MKNFQNQLQKITPAHKKENLSYFNLINKTIILMTSYISQMTIEKFPPDILIEVSRDSCGIFDFYKAEEMVEIGRISAQKMFEEYKNKINKQDFVIAK
jgi:NTE family protein